jgi:hypothetical protein
MNIIIMPQLQLRKSFFYLVVNDPGAGMAAMFFLTGLLGALKGFLECLVQPFASWTRDRAGYYKTKPLAVHH